MKILRDLNLDDAVFFDIETVNAVPKLEANTPLWEAWNYKNKFGREPLNADDILKIYDENAALYSEFGKIVCISVGKIKGDVIKLKSFVDRDEKQVLTDFCRVLGQIIGANKKTVLIGHAVKGFDIPWIVRRCIVNQVEIPGIIDTNHLKPWELHGILDTHDLWKGTGFNGASLIAIAVALGLVNPKEQLAGYETSATYYRDGDAGLQAIARYCERDVTTVANIVRRCRYESLVEAEDGEIKVKQVGVLNRIHNKGGESNEADQKEVVKNLNKLKGKDKEIGEDILAAIKN
jgi:uncharacterized protein YprB with RNaseH-like and TPR domain